MKTKCVVAFLMSLVSVPAFAGEEVSEFERGYFEGKASCRPAVPESAVVCTLPYVAVGKNFQPAYFTGLTRAHALLKANPEHLASVYKGKLEIICNQL